MAHYFPSRYGSEGGNENVLDELQRQNIALKGAMIADFNNDQELKAKHDHTIDEVNNYLLSMNTPQDFGEESENNIIRISEAIAESTRTILEEAGVSNIKELTVFEFESKRDFYEKRAKKTPKI